MAKVTNKAQGDHASKVRKPASWVVMGQGKNSKMCRPRGSFSCQVKWKFHATAEFQQLKPFNNQASCDFP